MPTPSGLVTKQELIDAQLDTAHLGRVVNSKDASGAPINTSTNRTGGVNKTLDALETEYLEAIQGAGGESVGTWTAGVTTFTKYNEYAVYNGIPYKPRTSATLPYVAQGADPTAAPDDANVQPYQEITEERVVEVVEEAIPDLTDRVYKSSPGKSAIDNMLEDFNLNPLMYNIGDIIKTGGTTWVYEDSTGPITTDNFRAFDCLNLMDFGTKGDKIADDTDAIQKAWDTAKNIADSRGYAQRIYAPAGAYRVTHNLWIYQKDGVQFVGDGRMATVFYIDPNFETGTVPADFQAIEGNLGYSYNTQKALFVIAARRVTGGPDDVIIPAGGDTAAWHLHFEGFGFWDESKSQNVDVFYAPRLAETKITDIYAFAPNRFQWSDDSYLMEISKVDIRFPFQPIVINTGTTYNMTDVSCANSVYGYKCDADYSSWNNVAIDHWGKRLTGEVPADAYAYDIKSTGMVLNGCGAEYGFGGLFSFVNRPASNITINGGMYIGGAIEGRDNWTGQAGPSDFGVTAYSRVNDCRLILNGANIRQVIHPNGVPAQGFEKMRVEVSGISNISLNNLGGKEATFGEIDQKWIRPDDFNVTGGDSTITIVNQDDKSRLNSLASVDLPYGADTTNTVIFDSVSVNKYNAYDDLTGVYTVPISGYYNVHLSVNYTLDSATGDTGYIALQKTSGSAVFIGRWDIIDSASNETNNISGHAYVKLNKGDQIQTIARVLTGVTGFEIIQQSNFQVVQE